MTSSLKTSDGLKNKVIVSTFSHQRSPIFRKTVEFHGGVVRELPLLRLSLARDLAEFDQCARRLKSFQLVVFSSPSVVKYFFLRLAQLGVKPSLLDGCHVAAIGSETTKALNKNGVDVDIYPKRFTAAHLVHLLKKTNKRWKVLIPCGNKSLWLKGDVFEETRFKVFTPILYVNDRNTFIGSTKIETELHKPFDGIVFTSPSGVDHMASILSGRPLSEVLAGKVVGSIGPTTSQACRSHGVKVTVEPRKHTITSLMWSLIGHFQAN